MPLRAGRIGLDSASHARSLPGTWHVIRRLVQIRLLDPEPMLFQAEVVYRDGVALGYLRAASYGWSLGGAVGLALVVADEAITPAWIREGRWEVDVAGTRHAALASLRPMYDPANERIKV